jgi:hypothetical protein
VAAKIVGSAVTATIASSQVEPASVPEPSVWAIASP